jgi:hypothetical protein
MKIEYESTIEELVETDFRMAMYAKRLRVFLRRRIIWGIALFVIVFLFTPEETKIQLLLASAACAIFISFSLLTYKRSYKKRIKNYRVRRFGFYYPMKCEYELTKKFLIFRYMGNELRFNWANVTEIKENLDDIEIHSKADGFALIPHRIFEDQIQIEDWKDFIKERVQNI